MTKGRMEAFSDGVFAVIITIMVLELKSPQGTSLAALKPFTTVEQRLHLMKNQKPCLNFWLLVACALIAALAKY